jgi:hypothetical protein
MSNQSVDAAASTSNKQKKLTDEERTERRREYYRKYREANKEKLAESDRKHYKANKEKIAERGRKYRKANKETIAERKRKYCEANKEKIAGKKRKYYEANKKKILENDRKYREANKKTIAGKRRNYRQTNKDAIRERLKSDPNKMIAKTLRDRFNVAFKGSLKNGSGVRDLGLSIDEFRVRIESMFDESMSWENRGSYWQFDHIYPLDKANLQDRVEVKAVANWRNYQPLEAGENIRKGNTVTPEAQKLFDDLKTQFQKENAA